MTTGEKLAALRKRKGITQDHLAEILKVSRQSVSRWELNAAFPETEKLIRLSRLLECSIDFLLNDELEEDPAQGERHSEPSADDCFQFIRECGYFFLATISAGKPHLRPMGMIYSDGKALFLVTDKRKNVYEDLTSTPSQSFPATICIPACGSASAHGRRRKAPMKSGRPSWIYTP